MINANRVWIEDSLEAFVLHAALVDRHTSNACICKCKWYSLADIFYTDCVQGCKLMVITVPEYLLRSQTKDVSSISQ